MIEHRQASAPRRGVNQERSLARRARIADAAIAVLASHGVAGLTHRLVAKQAGVSLAATTYYFDSKFDIVAAASSATLAGYVEAFDRVAERLRSGAATHRDFRSVAFRLVRNASARDRIGTTCWAEITLDARRHPESLDLSQRWFSQLRDIWRQIAIGSGVNDPDQSARSAIDLVIGLLILAVSLGLGEQQVDDVLERGVDPATAWWTAPLDAQVRQPGLGRKSIETRARILSSAIEILILDGPSAVTYRTVAARAGLTHAAPFYHFPTIAALLTAAQARLFEASKNRYRAVIDGSDARIDDLEHLIDRTAAVFLREATEYGSENLASYSIWLQAAREPALRGMIWEAFADQHRAWQRVLSRISAAAAPIDALLAQSLFHGKLVRILATGSTTDDLAKVRREFAADLEALTTGRFWAQRP